MLDQEWLVQSRVDHKSNTRKLLLFSTRVTPGNFCDLFVLS